MTKFIPPPNDKRKRGGGDDDEDGAAADDEDADLSKVSFCFVTTLFWEIPQRTCNAIL